MTDALAFPVNVDVAAIGHEGIRMAYNFNAEQCALWARGALDRDYAAAA